MQNLLCMDKTNGSDDTDDTTASSLSLSPYLSLLCSYNDCTSVASASSASALMPLLLLLSLPPLQKSINKCIVTGRRERERKKHFFNITFLILHPSIVLSTPHKPSEKAHLTCKIHSGYSNPFSSVF